MAKSKTYLSKTEYKKEWRRKNKEDKRFNQPLKEYLKLKHAAIYGEYCTFFKVLDKLNPTAKDLTKTATFNEWKKQLNVSDDEFGGPLIKLNTYYVKDDGETVTAATQELIAQKPDLHAEDTEGKLNTHYVKDDGETVTAATQELIAQEPDLHTEDTEGKLNTHYVKDDGETVTAATQELIAQEPDLHAEDTEGINIEFEQADNIIEQIINDLEQDQGIREILNGADVEPLHEVDEGIGLNVEDEIVDPFDFALEVDFDF